MSVYPHAREPLSDIVEESLDEAAFLWSRWEADLSSLTRNLDEVYIWTEDRMQGALDGVRVGGDGAVEKLLLPALTGDDLKRVTVAAHVMAAGMGARAVGALGEVLLASAGPALAALLRGIETATLDGSFAPVANKLAQGGPAACAALCQLKTFRRATVGAELAVAFQSEDAAHLGSALHAARFAGAEGAQFVELGLSHTNPAATLHAIESGMRLQLPAAWAAVRERAAKPLAADARLLRVAAALGAADEFRAIAEATSQEPLRRDALYALGHVGTADAVEICISHMSDANAARAAGEAYCAITGAQIERDNLALVQPDADSPEFEKDDLDANLVPAPQDSWPLPDADAVRKHWSGIRARFEPGARYLLGQPRNPQSLARAVESAPMLRRADWVFELGARTRGKYDVETRAFRGIQRHHGRAARAALGG